MQQGVLLYATRRQVYCKFDTNDMAFVGTMIWYHTHKQIHTKHTRVPIDWHRNIYQHHLLCAYSSYLYYIELITQWYQKTILHRSTISLFFKNYLLAKVTYLPIRFSKTKSFLGNTKNTYRNGENEQITHDTRHADRKMTRVG